jgi:hypothetical protein
MLEIAVAATLWGRKENVLVLCAPATLSDLYHVINTTLDAVMRDTCLPAQRAALRQTDYAFTAEAIQVLVAAPASASPVGSAGAPPPFRWRPLLAIGQVHHACQLFVFSDATGALIHGSDRDSELLPEARRVAPLGHVPQLLVVTDPRMSPRRRQLAGGAGAASSSPAAADGGDRPSFSMGPASPVSPASPALLPNRPQSLASSSSSSRGQRASPGAVHRAVSPTATSRAGTAPSHNTSSSRQPTAAAGAGASPPRAGSRPAAPLDEATVLCCAKGVFALLTSPPAFDTLDTAMLREWLLAVGIDFAQWEDPEFDFLASAALTAQHWPRLAWRDWLTFAARYPATVATLAVRYCREEALLPPPASPTPQLRTVSPERSPGVGSGQRQRHVAERLYSGLASVATAKDRRLGIYDPHLQESPNVQAAWELSTSRGSPRLR